MTEKLISPQYPCDVLPNDPAKGRLIGLYPQRTSGLWMQRIKAPGGQLTLAQWRAMADLAERLTPGYPLHLTTRQDVEFFGVKADVVPVLQKGLFAAGLNTVGACGDTLRNVTFCFGCCDGENSVILETLSAEIRKRLEAFDVIYALPRKFKVSISGCANACARPWINDLGFVAKPDGSFRAIVAGSLGAKPGIGIIAYESLSPVGVVALCEGAMRLFVAEGDRKNRARARLRHVRERLGNEAFLQNLDAYYQEALSGVDESMVSQEAPDCSPCENKPMLRLPLHHGDVYPNRLKELLDFLEENGGDLRVGVEHNLMIVCGVSGMSLPAFWQERLSAPSIVACPGTTHCSRALVDTHRVADAIAEAVPEGRDIVIGLSGCPNNCTHAAVSDIGVIGRLKKVNEERAPHFRLVAGGAKGKGPQLAQELYAALPVRDVAEAVKFLLERFENFSAKDSRSFMEFIRLEKDGLVASLLEKFPVGRTRV